MLTYLRYASFALVSVSILATAPLYAADNDSLTPQQQDQVRAIVKDYLKNQNNLISLVKDAGAAEQNQQQEDLKTLYVKHSDELFSPSNALVAGNPNGKITLVEFFDYLCPYCKMAAPTVSNLINQNKDLRVIFVQLPIHGDKAEFAALAVLAAAKQGKFYPLHEAIMNFNGDLTHEATLNLAKQVGLNIPKLTADMKSSAVTDQLKQDVQLAQTVQVGGTPTMILAKDIGSNGNQKLIIVPTQYPSLESAVQKLKQG